MIGIIFIGNLKYCPFLNKYIDIIKKFEIEYQVLFWDREAKGEASNYPDNYISFAKRSKLSKPKLLKFLDFVLFKIWINNKIKNNKYSGLIVLTTLSGILNYFLLINKYSSKYIFDIRDYSYENNKIFYYFEKRIIMNSFFTCISSDGFKNFLPKSNNYTLAHNFIYNDLKYKRTVPERNFKYGDEICLVFMGVIRYFEHQKEIICRFKNDARFRLSFYGTGPDLDKLKNFCDINKIMNVDFYGEYNNFEKFKFLCNADILNNSYGVSIDTPESYAVSNKFYDGLIFKIPQLVECGSYKYDLVTNYDLGIGLSTKDEFFADKLYDYYFSLNWDKFNETCESLLRKIIEDDKIYTEEINNFIMAL